MNKTHNFQIIYEETLGAAAMNNRGFYYPVDLDFGAKGKIYCLNRAHEGDTSGVRVCVLDSDSNYYGVFGSNGYNEGQFIYATGIAVYDEIVYVSDEHLNKISLFDSSGEFIKRWGVPGSKEGQLNGPSAIKFDLNGNLYIVDHLNNRIQVFDKDGKYISGFGSYGTNPGQFNLPWGITIDSLGFIYVSDWRNDRVQKFTHEGGFVSLFGSSGNKNGQFNRPSSVAVDLEGDIYITDWGNHRVQVFDKNFNFIQSLRGESTLSPWAKEFLEANPDEMAARKSSDLDLDLDIEDQHMLSSHIEKLFWAPISVKIDKQGKIYVVDRNRHRIQVYSKKIFN